MRFISLIVLLTLTLQAVTPTASQETLLPIFEGQEISNLSWSNDNQQLSFQSGYSTLSQPEIPWVVYDAVRATATDSASFTLPEELPASLIQRLDANLTQTNIFLSPDGRYAVAADVANDWTTVIVDTLENRVMDTQVRSTGISNAPERFFVLWSDDSQTLVFATSATLFPEPSFFHWVTGYVDADDELVVQEISSFVYNNVLYGILNLYDLSSDGTRVLAKGVAPETGQTGYPMVIWSRDGNHIDLRSVFGNTTESFSAASFAPNNENEILVVDQRGLVRYSLLTGETVILRSDITSQQFRIAKFSPNGEQLALVDNTPGRPAAVYILDVMALSP